MAARALTAAVRRVAGQTSRPPLLASCRNGASMNYSSASERRKIEQYKDFRAAAEAMTGMQVEGALNRKNVQVLHGEEHVATVLPDVGGGGVRKEDALWVPDQDTGVFVPADAHGSGVHAAPTTPHLYGGLTTDGSASVLDQEVFVREEDVERPVAIDIANANADVVRPNLDCMYLHVLFLYCM